MKRKRVGKRSSSAVIDTSFDRNCNDDLELSNFDPQNWSVSYMSHEQNLRKFSWLSIEFFVTE